MHLQQFIELKLGKEEGTVAMIKYDQPFHQKHTLIKMAKPLLILMSMANSNHLHMDKLGFIVLLVDDQMRIYMLELNEEDYTVPATELEDDEYEEGTSDDEHPEYLSDYEYVYDTEDGIPYRDNKQLGGKTLDMLESYKPLLHNYYSRAG